jgi:hypothetical protein
VKFQARAWPAFSFWMNETTPPSSGQADQQDPGEDDGEVEAVGGGGVDGFMWTFQEKKGHLMGRPIIV